MDTGILPPAHADLDSLNIGAYRTCQTKGGWQHGRQRSRGGCGFAILVIVRAVAVLGEFLAIIRQGTLTTWGKQPDNVTRTDAVFVEFFSWPAGRPEQVVNDHLVKLSAQVEMGGFGS